MILKIRSDIYFFDGQKMTADDVVFTFELIKWIHKYSPPWRALGEIIINATKVDEYTVKVYLNTTGFLASCRAFIMVFPKHVYELGETWGGNGVFPNWNVTPVQIVNYVPSSPSDPIFTGYGPFKLVDWSPSGSCKNATEFILRRNSNYTLRAVDEAGNTNTVILKISVVRKEGGETTTGQEETTATEKTGISGGGKPIGIYYIIVLFLIGAIPLIMILRHRLRRR